MANRKAFTLLEVLISIALLGIILVPLFSVVDLMRDSNQHLLKSLEKSKQVTKATKVLFLDILSSDGKLDIKKDEFTQLCIKETRNSLYNLPVAQVCWVILKHNNTLIRIEGNRFSLPLKSEDKVEIDTVMSGISLFDVYHEKDKVLVLLEQKDKKPITFMIQGITNPVLKVLPDGTKIMRDGRKVLPDGTQIFKDGSKILPDGTTVPSPKKNMNNRGRRGAQPNVRPGNMPQNIPGAPLPNTPEGAPAPNRRQQPNNPVGIPTPNKG